MFKQRPQQDRGIRLPHFTDKGRASSYLNRSKHIMRGRSVSWQVTSAHGEGFGLGLAPKFPVVTWVWGLPRLDRLSTALIFNSLHLAPLPVMHASGPPGGTGTPLARPALPPTEDHTTDDGLPEESGGPPDLPTLPPPLVAPVGPREGTIVVDCNLSSSLYGKLKHQAMLQ